MSEIKVGDRIYYKGPRGSSGRADCVVVRLHHNNTTADVLHDNGHTYKGYLVSRMTKYDGDEADYTFERRLRLEKEIELAIHLGYFDMAEKLSERLESL